MNMLAIDTSNQVLGISIMRQGQIIGELTTNIKKDHSSRLMPAIVDLMERLDMTPNQLDKIVVSHGPGSYTGTRIGVTTAKTIAWALKLPITPVSSLKALAYNGRYFDGYICPFFDARRQSVFTGLYYWKENKLIEKKQEMNIAMEEWLEELVKLDKAIIFLSPDMEVFKEMILEKLQNTIIPDLSCHLLRPSNLLMLEQFEKTVSVHDVVPNYIRITEAEANWLKQQKDEQYHD